MIEQADLEAAVTAKLLTAGQRDALTEFVRTRNRATLGADEEQFRFITSFNDIFVTIAVALLLFAVGFIGGQFEPWVAAGSVAAVSWALAEHFTRVKRMSLPSIVLLLTFVGSSFATAGTVITAITGLEGNVGIGEGSVYAVIAGLVTCAAAAAHWRRFQVPITVAAGAAAVSGIVVSLVAASSAGNVQFVLGATALCGVAMFAVAMRFDFSDRERSTRRTDIAFWLHFFAAPMIVHPLFVLSGVRGGILSNIEAAGVVATYLVLTAVALAIDRRAFLVSALLYMGWAVQALFEGAAPVEMGVAYTALVLGLFLVLLSAGWRPIRSRVVAMLPSDLSTKLPVTA